MSWKVACNASTRQGAALSEYFKAELGGPTLLIEEKRAVLSVFNRVRTRGALHVLLELGGVLRLKPGESRTALRKGFILLEGVKPPIRHVVQKQNILLPTACDHGRATEREYGRVGTTIEHHFDVRALSLTLIERFRANVLEQVKDNLLFGVIVSDDIRVWTVRLHHKETRTHFLFVPLRVSKRTERKWVPRTGRQSKAESQTDPLKCLPIYHPPVSLLSWIVFREDFGDLSQALHGGRVFVFKRSPIQVKGFDRPPHFAQNVIVGADLRIVGFLELHQE